MQNTDQCRDSRGGHPHSKKPVLKRRAVAQGTWILTLTRALPWVAWFQGWSFFFGNEGFKKPYKTSRLGSELKTGDQPWTKLPKLRRISRPTFVLPWPTDLRCETGVFVVKCVRAMAPITWQLQTGGSLVSSLQEHHSVESCHRRVHRRQSRVRHQQLPAPLLSSHHSSVSQYCNHSDHTRNHNLEGCEHRCCCSSFRTCNAV